MTRAVRLLVLSLALVATNLAFADTFHVTYSGADIFTPSDTASGTFDLTAVPQSSGVFLVTGISGQATYGNTLYTISGLTPPGGFGGNDNLLYFPPPSPGGYVDLNGLTFTLNNNAYIENLFFGSGGTFGNLFAIDESIGPTGNAGIQNILSMSPGDITVTDITATPEPSTFVLMSTCLGLVFATVRRRMTGS